MIPKVIHYCWFGRGALPTLAEKCIASWRKYLPDYEIKEWNEDNFDVRSIPYTAQAYDARKYAFVSDYARFWILYHYGGLYFDVDVEVVRPMYHIIDRGNFMGCERRAGTALANMGINPGLGLGVAPGLGLLKELIDLYGTLTFTRPDGSLNTKTIVEYTTECLVNHGLQNIDTPQLCANIWIYPKDYFNPINPQTGRIELSENTVSIHHYAASWVDNYSRFRGRIYHMLQRTLGNGLTTRIRGLVGRKKKN
ncbi:MAG: glycosyl transferase [Bacteroidales bacterium]|nr:glycosyl transferase [Bacteroidales bacterium]